MVDSAALLGVVWRMESPYAPTGEGSMAMTRDGRLWHELPCASLRTAVFDATGVEIREEKADERLR